MDIYIAHEKSHIPPHLFIPVFQFYFFVWREDIEFDRFLLIVIIVVSAILLFEYL